jgi:hypothetical protein
MDSRPHDDFPQSEWSLRRDETPSSETESAGPQALAAAPAEAAPPAGPAYSLDDLELELASLLAPDLDAMGFAGRATDAADRDAGDAPDAGGHDAQDAGRPHAALAADGPAAAPDEAGADASDQPGAARAAAAQPAPDAAFADGSAAAEEAEALIEAIELELALDGIVADAFAAEAQAGDDRAAGETGVFAPVETGAVPQVDAPVETAAVPQGEARVDATAEPAGDAAADGDAMAVPAADAPVVAEMSAVAPDGASSAVEFHDGAAAVTAEPPVAERAGAAEAIAMLRPEETAETSVLTEAAPPAEPAAAEASVAAPAARAAADDGQADRDAVAGETAEAAEDAGAARGDADIVVAGAILVAQRDGDVPATAAGFAEALGAQDILAKGFEAAVRSAAAQSKGRFLFQMPVHTVHDCQRVAAVNLAGDESPTTMLVLLAADGRTFRLEDARASDNPFAGMAVSYGGLLAHLKSLPTRAAA